MSLVYKKGSKVMVTAAVIVAAGLSSRMGAFKPLLSLGGETIITKSIKTLQSAGIEIIVVVTGYRANELEEHLSAYGVEFVRNEHYAETDMFFSASLGLERVLSRCDRVLFLPADSPLFLRESLYAMFVHQDETGSEVVIPTCLGRGGHPLLMNSSVLPELLLYSGGDGMRGAISSLNLSVSRLELDDKGLIMDADSPEDYVRLKQNLQPCLNI
jgi:molybdenum cofactor cytidylyltransferase